MSISKAVVLCCALIGAHSVSAEPTNTADGRIIVQHNPPGDLLGKLEASVPPDPYRTALHNPPGDKTLVGDLSVPPDPYITILHQPPMFKTGVSDVMHNPPGY